MVWYYDHFSKWNTQFYKIYTLKENFVGIQQKLT